MPAAVAPSVGMCFASLGVFLNVKVAPLNANAEIGQVLVKDGDAVVGKVPALAADPVEKQTSVWDRLF